MVNRKFNLDLNAFSSAVKLNRKVRHSDTTQSDTTLRIVPGTEFRLGCRAPSMQPRGSDLLCD
jgi:hypothetical protein